MNEPGWGQGWGRWSSSGLSWELAPLSLVAQPGEPSVWGGSQVLALLLLWDQSHCTCLGSFLTTGPTCAHNSIIRQCVWVPNNCHFCLLLTLPTLQACIHLFQEVSSYFNKSRNLLPQNHLYPFLSYTYGYHFLNENDFPSIKSGAC